MTDAGCEPSGAQIGAAQLNRHNREGELVSLIV